MNKIENDKDKGDLFYFLSLLKQYFPKQSKHVDKSSYEIEIKSCQNNPSNFKIDIFTFDKLNFNQYFDCKLNYINKAILIITFSFKVKNENEINNIKEACNAVINNIIKNFPEKEKSSYQFYISKNDNNIFLDFALFKEEIIKALLDVGINFTEYENFHFSLSSLFTYR